MKNCKKSLFSHFFYPLIFQGVKIWVLVVKNSKNLKWPAKITQIFRSFNINKIKILLSMKLKFHVEWAISLRNSCILTIYFCRNASKLLLEFNLNFLQLEFLNYWTDRAAIFRICFFCTDYLLFVELLLNQLMNWTQISYSLTTEWIELIYLKYFY